ncbi:MAG: hypothetical protein SGBAC_003497 [Bacillariaceae sp.]
MESSNERLKDPEQVVLDRHSLIQKHIEQLSQMNVGLLLSTTTNHEKLAYFRACNGSVEQATRRLQATLEWRTQTGISNLLTDPIWLTKERSMRKTLWYDYLGPDCHGRPVLVERGGRWDVGQVLSSVWPHYYNAKVYPDDGIEAKEQDKIDEESFVKLHCMSCEVMLQMDRHCSTPDTPVKDDRGMVIIMDLKGLRPWHLDPRLATAFGKIAAVNSAHYPDTLAHVWVVNAPYLFNGLSRMVQPFLDPDTVGKFHVSSGIPPELADCVGSGCLPEELGGSRKGIFPYAEDAPMSDYPK